MGIVDARQGLERRRIAGAEVDRFPAHGAHRGARRAALVEDEDLCAPMAAPLHRKQRQEHGFAGAGWPHHKRVADIANMQIEPERRKLLLQSISEAAATAPGWSTREPCFYPEWVDKEAA